MRPVPYLSRRRTLPLLADAVIVLVIFTAAFALLKPPLAERLVRPFNGDIEILPTTAWAAVKVWTFWGISAAVVAGLLLRHEPRLGVLDALIAGSVSPWIVAWIGDQALGPLGLYRAGTIWVMLVLAG